MKKHYVKPLSKKVDFVYDEQVVAASEIGIQARPTHPTDCQYTKREGFTCLQIYSPELSCSTAPWSLRRG